MSPLPPSRDGVGPSCVGLVPGPWPTMLDFLLERFAAIPADEWLRRLDAGDVLDEFGAVVTPTRVYQAHIRLYYYRSLAQETRVPFDEMLLFQDEQLVVADKPHFLSVTPGGPHLQETLLVRLKKRLGLDTLQPIHRIDRETAGLVVFCVQPQQRDAYHALFRAHTVCKTYQAVAPWRTDLELPLTRHSRIVQGEPFFRQCEVPGQPNASTGIELMERRDERARYLLRPHTGQKHQLRVHLAAMGLPIENDPYYPVLRRAQGETDDWTRPLQLLAKSIAFTDPVTGQARCFESPRELAL